MTKSFEFEPLDDLDNDCYHLDPTDYIEEAKKEGYSVIISDNKHLFIDIDSEKSFQTYQKMLPHLEHFFSLRVESDQPSKDGLPKRHIILKLYKDLPIEMRVALQACLGSDLVREMNSILRCFYKISPVSFFFEKKGGKNDT